MQRRPTAELLDDDLGTPAEIAQSLVDLRHINRWFGGTATTISMLERVAAQTGSTRLSLLEVASGAGDVPASARDQLRHRGVELSVTLLDRNPSHFNGNPASHVAGDALLLPLADSSFDVVGCTLFAHHLSPEDLQKFVTEALRVCRQAVLINDLVRNPVHLGLVYLSLPLYRSRITHHDAPASVRQSYTLEEMRVMLRQTPAARVEIDSHFLFRMGVIAWK
jgi:ubiquinone/menaquinone biosynthesis C-methylase UbiE